MEKGRAGRGEQRMKREGEQERRKEKGGNRRKGRRRIKEYKGERKRKGRGGKEDKLEGGGRRRKRKRRGKLSSSSFRYTLSRYTGRAHLSVTETFKGAISIHGIMP